MQRYIEHIKNTRTPHERRTHAMQVSGVITALIFVGWMGTLGLRLGLGDDTTVAQDDGNQTTLPANGSLSASAAAATQNNQAHLEVSTTSVGY